ncbi:MAG: hypothetical protein AAF389_10100 [Gemmatimonadota bacterium]
MKNTLRMLSLLAVFGAAACDEALVPGELSEADAEALAGVIMESMFSNSTDVPSQAPAVDGPQTVPFEFSTDVTFTADCPMGGAVTIDGSATIEGDTEAEGARIAYEVTHTHAACSGQDESGKQFTISGAPDLTFDFVAEVEGESVGWEGSVTGGIDWEFDGMMGMCEVNYAFSGSATGEESVTAMLEGTICGYLINQSLTVG